MPAVMNATSPHPYKSKQNELLHSGIVPVTGSTTIDLGIGHNNFVPSISHQGSLAATANLAHVISWAYGTKLGTFIIYAWKVTTLASNPTLIAATAAINVSFTAIADSSVG